MGTASHYAQHGIILVRRSPSSGTPHLSLPRAPPPQDLLVVVVSVCFSISKAFDRDPFSTHLLCWQIDTGSFSTRSTIPRGGCTLLLAHATDNTYISHAGSTRSRLEDFAVKAACARRTTCLNRRTKRKKVFPLVLSQPSGVPDDEHAGKFLTETKMWKGYVGVMESPVPVGQSDLFAT